MSSEITSDRRLEIVKSLRSGSCEGCGGFKRPGFSHCSKCYYKLSVQIRKRLYLRVGNGYEEAFEESLKVLKGGSK
jgi:hypothetical protein